jgi:hypothetical protein
MSGLLDFAFIFALLLWWFLFRELLGPMTRQIRPWQSEDDEKMMSGKNLPLGYGRL